MTMDIAFVAALLSATSGIAQTPPAAVPVSPPQVTAPQVTAPSPPVVSKPAGAATASPNALPTTKPSGPVASIVATTYDEVAFKKASDLGAVILLIFSGATDSIWLQQAKLLPTILREAEFGRIVAFQIDMTNTELAEKYGAKSAGTLILMKDGFERLRSTQMTKSDVIRKMLRFHSAL